MIKSETVFIFFNISNNNSWGKCPDFVTQNATQRHTATLTFPMHDNVNKNTTLSGFSQKDYLQTKRQSKYSCCLPINFEKLWKKVWQLFFRALSSLTLKYERIPRCSIVCCLTLWRSLIHKQEKKGKWQERYLLFKVSLLFVCGSR